jgi:hypothetical protein
VVAERPVRVLEWLVKRELDSSIVATETLTGVEVEYQRVPLAPSFVFQVMLAVVEAVLVAARLLITGAVVSGVVVAGRTLVPQVPIESP